MSRNVHSMGEEFHFGELPAGRVLTEDMTNFSAGLPVETVLAWVNDRLGLTEAGVHKVGFFGINAVTLIPSFTLDAIKENPNSFSFTMDARFPGLFANGGVFRIDAIVMPSFTIGAWIKRPGPDAIIHQDFFTNQWLDSWGTPDTGIGWPYTYSNVTMEDRSDKFEITQDVNDPDFPDYRGLYVEYDSTNYVHAINDVGLSARHLIFEVEYTRHSRVGGQNPYRFYFGRGTNTYLVYGVRGAGTLGPDYIQLYVNGVEEIYQALGDSGGIFNTYSLGGGIKIIEIYTLGNHLKARIYNKGDTPPAWQKNPPDPGKVISWTGTFPTGGNTQLQWLGHGDGFPVYDPGGSPWTHWMSQWTVWSLGAGRMTTDAFIQPYFNLDAVLIRGGTVKMDAFILPHFFMDAQIVIRTTSGFTMDAVIPLKVNKTFTVNAFKKPFFTIDAWLFAPTKEGDFTMDAAFVETEVGAATMDAVIRDTDRQYSFTLGTIKQENFSDSTTLDAAFCGGGTFTIDSWLRNGIQINAVKFQADIEHTFTMDAAKIYWADLRSFWIDAYIVIEQTGSFTMDAWKKTAPDEYVHYDDFDNRTISLSTSGLTVRPPSRAGYYSDTESSSVYGVSGGVMQYREELESGYVFLAETGGHNIDREIYFEVNRESNSGVSIGDIYYWMCGNIKLRNHLNGSLYYVQYNGSDTAYYLNPGTTGWVAIRFHIYNKGRNIKWKIWNRSSTEPALWMQWIDADALGWTLTDDDVRIEGASASWFGQGSPPFDHYFDNIKVSVPTGWPYIFTVGASKREYDITHTFKAEAIKLPVPFTMDAYVQPYFRMDARIWLGTGFTMDAVILRHQEVGDPKIGYTYVNANSAGSWTHNPPTNAKMLFVYATHSTSSSVTYGNVSMTQVPGQTEDWYIHIDDLGTRDDNVVRPSVNGAMMGSIWLTSLHDIEYVTNASGWPTITMNDTVEHGAAHAIAYRFGAGKNDPFSGASAYTEAASQGQYPVYGELLNRNYSTNPITGWSSAASINTDGTDRFSITGGVVGGPISSGHGILFQAPAPHTQIHAWIAGGGKFFIQAWKKQESPLTFSAIKEAPFSFSFTMDAARFDFGTQLRDFTMDAVLAPANDETRVTQFGWMMLGDMMWGDVTPGRETNHFSVGAWIAGRITIDALIDTGHIKIYANILWDDRLWNYENYSDHPNGKPDAGRKDDLRIFMWDWYS